MELRKRHITKENPTIDSSRLLGIIARAEHNIKKNNASSRYYMNYEAEKTIRDAMLQAELRKAQSRKTAFMSGINR